MKKILCLAMVLVFLFCSVAHSEGATDLDLADLKLYMGYAGETKDYKEKIGQQILDFGEMDATELTYNEVLLYAEYCKLYLQLFDVYCLEIVAWSSDITDFDGMDEYINYIGSLQEQFVDDKIDAYDIQTMLRDMMNGVIESDLAE